MKKKLFIILFILVIIIVTIKFFPKSLKSKIQKNEIIICTKSDSHLTSKVELTAVDGIVKKARFDQIYTTNNKELAGKKKEEYSQIYFTLGWKYGGYNSGVAVQELNNYKMIAFSNADYSKFDGKKYVKDYPKRKKYFDEDYNILLEQVVNAYEAMDAVCKEKN